MSSLLLLASVVQLPVGQLPNSDLAREVVADYPGLRLLTRDIDRVRLLREWAWGRCNCTTGAEGAYEVAFANEWHNVWTAEEMFARLGKRESGVMCGGASIALKRLYEHFGYRAWSACHEKIGMYGHAATLVEIEHNGRTMIVMEDPTWNVEFTELNSDPIDYRDFLARLRQREHATILTFEPDWRGAPRFPANLVPAAFIGIRDLSKIARASNNTMIERYSVEIIPNGSLLVTSPRTWTNYLTKKCLDADGNPIGHLAQFPERGLPTELVYWYSFPESIGGPDHAELLAQAKSAAGL